MREEGPQDWSERTISRERRRAEQAVQDARAQLLEAREQEEKDGDFVAAAFAVISANEERIRELQDRLDELDRLSLKALTEAREELDDVRRNANRAKDGRNVYRATDGNTYDEEGKLVRHDEIDWTTWRDDGPSQEQYLRGRDRVDRLTEYRERLHEQQERLEHKPSDKDLDDVDKELDELESDMDETLGNGYARAKASSDARTTSAAKALDGDDDTALMLRRPFGLAASGDASDVARDRPDVPINPGGPTPA